MKHLAANNKGMSLIGILVASLVVFLVGMATMSMLGQTMKSNQVVLRESDLEDVRNYFRMNFDCAATVNVVKTVCPASTVSPVTVSLHDAKGTTLVSTAGPVAANYLGPYQLRGKCVPDGSKRSIVIEARRDIASASNSPAKKVGSDTLEDWRILFSKVPLGCNVVP